VKTRVFRKARLARRQCAWPPQGPGRAGSYTAVFHKVNEIAALLNGIWLAKSHLARFFRSKTALSDLK
jgi:hypothetical protein